MRCSVYPAETNTAIVEIPFLTTDIPVLSQEDNSFALLESQSNHGMITGIVMNRLYPGIDD